MLKQMAVLLFGLGVAVMIAALPRSFALHMSADRGAGTPVGDDSVSVVGLGSFNNSAFSITNTYSQAGTITNNAGDTLSFVVDVSPVVTQACSAVDRKTGQCTSGSWTLAFCLAADLASVGKRVCQGKVAQELTFSDLNAAPHSLAAVPASAGQTLYLLVRGDVGADRTQLLCAYSAFSISGTGSGSGQSVSLSDGAVLRRQIYRLGSGCP